jgi:two-component system chemotaxis response regulator CheB
VLLDGRHVADAAGHFVTERCLMIRDIVVVGASTGGIAALRGIVGGLAEGFPGSVFIVMHMAEDSPGSLAGFLSRCGRLPVTSVEAAEGVEPGRIYVAPPDRHLILGRSRVRALFGPKENRFRPAIDPLFRSAALAFGPRVVGVVLTGHLDDGTAGLAAIKQAGGVAIVQDPQDAEAPGMPRSALRHVAVDHCLALGAIAPALAELAMQPIGAAEELGPIAADDLQTETDILAGVPAAAERVLKLGDPSPFTFPECRGSLIQLRGDAPKRFRCHTGHAFTADSLAAAMGNAVEGSLWRSLRGLQELAMLLNHMAEHVENSDRQSSLRRRSREVLRRADLVRQALLVNLPGGEPDAGEAVAPEASEPARA